MRVWLGVFLLQACTAARSAPAAEQVKPSPAVDPAVEPAPRPVLPVERSARRPSAEPKPCGALGCRLFDDLLTAFEFAIRSRPRILAVGESHAQKEGAGVRSATARFTEELLPPLRGRAAALVVELMLPATGCRTETETVRERQQEVTREQSSENQNEFLTLGQRARAIGIVPYPLRPSCDDLSRIAAAGDDAVIEMLTAIARLSTKSAKDLLGELDRAGSDRMVVMYGGALHNDLHPEPGRAAWSFGPELTKESGGRYVAVDLIVPELIRDTEVWRRLPWYPLFDPNAHPEKVTLYEIDAQSYVIVFARTAGPPPSSPVPGQ
jgi:hypothetical protein